MLNSDKTGNITLYSMDHFLGSAPWGVTCHSEEEDLQNYVHEIFLPHILLPLLPVLKGRSDVLLGMLLIARKEWQHVA